MAKREVIKLDPRIDGSQPPDLTGGFLVVGIGASAGGLQALREFFRHVKSTSGAAYVVILHLSPNHESKLAEVLQQVAAIPVTRVSSRTTLAADHVYVVPPDRSLRIVDGSIEVKPLETIEERRAPVDIFFRTLADYHGPNSVGVILSGTGADGSMGIKRIKEMGGTTFVQNPREAEFNEMPRNSIATELIDSILNVADIPRAIEQYRQHRSMFTIPDKPPDSEDGQRHALREIFAHLRMRTGHDFSNYKRATMLRRIERRMSVRNLPDLNAYSEFLRGNPEEAHSLLKDLLISVTNFFRDKETFASIEKNIFSKLLDRANGRPIRMWIPGCATGEEAYSFAMIAAEQTESLRDETKFQIFATDLDEQAISVAREGLYTLNDAADVSPERLRRFFTQEGDAYRVRRELRETILFAQHNLIKDPPFSHLDVVSCRNLLIYLNQTAQERVLETVHFALDPGGYFILGSAESVDGATDLFAPVDKANRIYQSRHVTSKQMPVPESVPLYHTERFRAPKKSKGIKDGSLERESFSDLHLRLIEAFAPPSLIVDQNYDIIHLSDRAGKYLQVTGGEPSKNLLKLVLPAVRMKLRSALFQAVQQKTNVEISGLTIESGDTTENINLLIRPVISDSDTARGYILVVFEPATGDASAIHHSEYVPSELLARQLEDELVRSREQLQTALEQAEVQSEELRASNEELHAMNEELRSSTEELETSKEELQSINEELSTVNQELKVKIDELSNANNNFQNLLSSADIGVIFLDRSLRVNLFSPATREIFNLIPSDIGRPVTDITNNLLNVDIRGDADLVLDKLTTVERELETTDGRVFLMRVLPYRTTEDRINGVVLTFVDFTEFRRAAAAVAHTEEQFRRAIEEAPIPVIMHAEDGEVLQISHTWTELTGYSINDVPNFDTWLSLAYGEGADRVRSHMHELFKGNKRSINVDFPIKTKKGQTRHWSFSASAPGTLRDGRRFIVGMAVDVTERRLVDEALRQSEQQMRLLIQSANDYAIFTLDKRRKVTSWSSGAEAILGYTEAEMIGQSGDIIFTPEDRKKGVPRSEAETAREEGRAENERWHIRKDGTRLWASGSSSSIRDSSGELVGFVTILRDLTERRETEEALRKSEQRLQRVLETDAVGVIFFDHSGTVVGANHVFMEMTGYTRADIDSKTLTWRVMTPPEWIPESEAQMAKFEATGRIGPYTKEYIVKDGSRRWMLFAGRDLGDGTIAEFCFDITESKLTEEALRKSEESYRTLFESIDEGYCTIEMLFDDNGKPIDYRFLQVNPAFERQSGIKDAVGRTIREIAPQHEDYWFEIYGEVAISRKPLRFERRAEQLGRWFDVYAMPVDDPALNRVGILFNDIAARKEAEEALRQSEERLRSVVESVTDYAIFTMGPDSKILSWNAGAERVFGWTEQEALGRSSDIIFTPEDIVDGAPDMERQTAIIHGRAPDERFHLRKDGTRFYVSGVMTSIRDSNGELKGFAKIARDMTERHEIEKALQDKEMLQKLVAAQEEERKRFARDLHDELGQQLTVLRMKLDSIRSSCQDAETQENIDEVERIARSIDEGVDFLAWEMRPAALDDLGLVVALDKFTKQWSHHSGIDAALVGSTIRNVRFDPNVEINLYRIAQEALNNIQKHSKATHVDVMLERRGPSLVLVIEDDGKGFNTKNRKFYSKGIGLSGMRERAELLGGTMEIESTPRKGTTVFVTIPATALPKGK